MRQDTITISDTEVRIVNVPNPVNQELLEKYNKATDSLSKLELHKEAITERLYKETLTDSVQTITVSSKVIGTLKEQKISYKTNPVNIEIKSKKPSLEVFAGGTTTIPTEVGQKIGLGATLSLLNKNKSQIYSVGYDANKNVIVGVSFKLF